MRESSYNLPLGMYWNLTRIDATNGSMYRERVGAVMRRIFGEPTIVEPEVWRVHDPRYGVAGRASDGWTKPHKTKPLTRGQRGDTRSV